MTGFDSNRYIQDILSEQEIANLESFNANPVMKEAVRKVLLLPLYYQGTFQKGKPANPMWNFMMGLVGSDAKATPEEIGRYAKIQYEGISAVEVAFDRISNFQKIEKVALGENPAR